MAHTISHVTNTMGVCFGTVGPGATNLVPGVAAAYADNIPFGVDRTKSDNGNRSQQGTITGGKPT